MSQSHLRASLPFSGKWRLRYLPWEDSERIKWNSMCPSPWRAPGPQRGSVKLLPFPSQPSGNGALCAAPELAGDFTILDFLLRRPGVFLALFFALERWVQESRKRSAPLQPFYTPPFPFHTVLVGRMQSGDTTDRRSLIPGADILGARVGGWLVCGPLLGEFEVGSKQSISPGGGDRRMSASPHLVCPLHSGEEVTFPSRCINFQDMRRDRDTGWPVIRPA